MKAGIYCIKNDINGKVYVGKAKNLSNRWEQHKSKLLKDNHDNALLQQDFNEYGIDAFTFSVLEYVPEQTNLDKILFAKEKEWGNKLNARDENCGYNIANFQQQKENDYREAKSQCFPGCNYGLQYPFVYIAYNLPNECYAIYLHLIERAMYYGTSGVEKEDDGIAVITLQELALLTNISEAKAKKLIMEMKKHSLLKPYVNRKNSLEYGIEFEESKKYKKEIEKKWKEI